jgi:peroxiredoxin
MPRLNNGDDFPILTLDTVREGALSVTHHLAGSYGVVLLYRGSWCPYCNAQLSAFARAKDKFDELGIGVVAMSVDEKVDAAALVEKHRLNFPVGYGLDAGEIAASTGAYVNESPRYLQSTGFVLDPNGKVITAVYSSGAIGRLVADDVIGFVRYVKSKEPVTS